MDDEHVSIELFKWAVGIMGGAILGLSAFIAKLVYGMFKLNTENLEARRGDAVRDEQSTAALQAHTKAVERLDTNVSSLKARPESER